MSCCDAKEKEHQLTGCGDLRAKCPSPALNQTNCCVLRIHNELPENSSNQIGGVLTLRNVNINLSPPAAQTIIPKYSGSGPGTVALQMYPFADDGAPIEGFVEYNMPNGTYLKIDYQVDSSGIKQANGSFWNVDGSSAEGTYEVVHGHTESGSSDNNTNYQLTVKLM